MEFALILTFWLCVLVVVYPYTFYPALLVALNRLLQRHAPSADADFVPTITVICPVHDEARLIAHKVGNLLDSDYPPDRLQVLVVGDGCTDDSLQKAKWAGAERVQVIDLPRGGKASALNEGVARAIGEIVVFTDAGIRTERHALRALAGHFADRTIGCVSGEDRILDGSGEGFYGRIEIEIRRQEARLHSIAGASGCLYAVRKTDCRPFLAGMAPDFLSVLDVVRAGKRAICEPAARGLMSATQSIGGEFERKKRTILRGMTALFANTTLLSPFRHPTFSFILVSHKLLRWFGPLALMGALAASVLLVQHQVYRIALAVQFTLYLLALVGILYPGLAARAAMLRICAFFALVNCAAAAAWWQWLRGSRQEIWQPTRRVV